MINNNDETRPNPSENLDEFLGQMTVGKPDLYGVTVINIFTRNQDYCIYEVEHPDIYYRLRVIFSKTPQPEIVERWNAIQLKLLSVISLLVDQDPNRHTNLIQRIAHTTSRCLRLGEQAQSDILFKELKKEILKEYTSSAIHRRNYFLVIGLMLVVLGLITMLQLAEIRSQDKLRWDQLYFVLFWFSGILGGILSMFKGAKKINFYISLSYYYYFFLGLERFVVITITTWIGYIFLESNIIFVDIGIFVQCDPNKDMICFNINVKNSCINESNLYKMMAYIVVIGFSENWIPSVINNFDLTKSIGTLNK